MIRGSLCIAAGITCFALDAVAASPSFDCAKARKADETAICASDELSKNDLATTRLFEKLRKADRRLAVKIAKAFLYDRGRCSGEFSCIAAAQAKAIQLFNSAIDVPGSVVPKQETASPAPAPPNPWPNSYARRSYKLGMSLAEFRATPYPDPDKTANAYSVCSDESRSADTGYYASQFYSDAFKAAGMVVCRFYYDYQMTDTYSSVFEAGVVLGDMSVLTGFNFIPDDAGTLRLFWIETEGPAESFASLVSTMQKAYGQPSIQTETWQNKIGNTFDNEIATWTNESSKIEFRHFGSTINKFELNHTLTPLWKKLSGALDARDDAAAQKL